MRQIVQGSVSHKNLISQFMQYVLGCTSIVQIPDKGSCKTDLSDRLNNINKSGGHRIRLTLHQLLIELIQRVQKMFARSPWQDFPC